MTFDFNKEMMYMKRHLHILRDYNKNKYDFREQISKIFEIDISQLDKVHTHGYHYDVFQEFGPDTQTWYHETFYEYLKSDKGGEMKSMYDILIKEVILPYLGLNEALVQKFPSFRIQLPENVAVAKRHNDHSLGHPYGEVNFTYTITDMNETNAILIEKTTGKNDFVPMEMEANNIICFNGNQNLHFNNVNKTGKTRMSMDFRVLPMNYIPEQETSSHSTNTKFADGGYYKYFDIS